MAELDGRIVAYARASWAIRDGGYTYHSDGEVDPSVRRRGIGRALLHAEQERLRAIAAGHPADVREALPGLDLRWPGRVPRRSSAGDGYEPIRYFAEMARRSTSRSRRSALPAGLEIRPVDPADHRRIFDAEAEAFRDHWGYREWTDADFARTFSAPTSTRRLWRVAWAGDEVAGVVVTAVFPKPRTPSSAPGAAGSTRSASAGRGGSAAGQRAHRERARRASASAGSTRRMLGVDAENPTGALRLYESLGFRVAERRRGARRGR